MHGSFKPAGDELVDYALAFCRRYETTHSVRDLSQGLMLLQQALALPRDAVWQARVQGNYATALRRLFDATGNRAALDDAIAGYRAAIAIGALGVDDHVSWRRALSRALRVRFDLGGNTADLNEAIVFGREARSYDWQPSPNTWAAWLSDWADDLEERSREAAANAEDSAISDTDEAVQLRLGATRAARADYPDWAGLWSNLGFAFTLHSVNAEVVGDRRLAGASAEAALAHQRQAIEWMRDGHPFAYRILANFARAILAEARCSGNLEQLGDAVAALERACKLASPPFAVEAVHVLVETLRDIASALHAASWNESNFRYLDRAIEHYRALLTVLERTGAARQLGPARVDLARCLRRRFEHARQRSDLEEAIAIAREELSRAPQDERADTMRVLGVCLALDARDPATFTEAIAMLRAAAEELDRRSPTASRKLAEHDLATALGQRYEAIRDLADLDESIALAQNVLAAETSEDPADHGHRCHGLGISFQVRYRQTGDPADLDAAIAYLEQSLEHLSQPGDRRRADSLNSLGLALQLRHGSRGDLGDLDRAIEMGRAALDLTPEDELRRAAYLSNLGLAYRIRFERSGSDDDLDMAVQLGRDSARGDTDESAPSFARFNLAKALYARGKRRASLEDLRDSLQLAFGLARHAEAPRYTRLQAAILCGAYAGTTGDWKVASAAYELAISLLELVVWHGLSREARERLLVDVAVLAPLAAAAALQIDEPALALALLDQGRAILWAQHLRLRQSFDHVREVAPELEQRLLESANDLSVEPGDGAAPEARSSKVQKRESRQAAAAQWDRTVDAIRALPGLEGFLQPPALSALTQSAPAGPIVVLNVSEYRCDALFITTRGVHSLRLSRLTLAQVNAVAEAHIDNLDELSDHSSSQDQRDAAERTLLDRLEWLRTTITEPILDELERLGVLNPALRLSRVWWCPTGQLCLLPLHAAAQRRVISSYTPTLSGLLAARSRPKSTPGAASSRLLIVAVSQTAAGEPPLDGALLEAEQLRQRFPLSHTLRRDTGASHDQIERDLVSHDYAHFACHGSQDLSNPSSAALQLYDRPLAMLELARLRLSGELAFLSACDTAKGGLELPDEAIHLAAAMQAAGFRHVIATFWPIRDRIAAIVTESVYEKLAPRGVIDAEMAASALHTAVTRLQSTYPTRPSIWATYAHFGP